MANGVSVCECGRIHWNNSVALKELYELIQKRQIQPRTIAAYWRYKKAANNWISPSLAAARFSKLESLGLINQIPNSLQYEITPRH